VVSKVVNAATFDLTPLVAAPGNSDGVPSDGQDVSVTFDGLPANLLYNSDGQINFQVPDLGSKTSASLVVTVDGVSSAATTVLLAPACPLSSVTAILNQDNSVNAAASSAPAGSILQIFATGIPPTATVSVQIADRKNLVPLYAGPVRRCPAFQQVNVRCPANWPPPPLNS